MHASAESQSWTPSKWSAIIALLIALHLGWIFWLSRGRTEVPPPAGPWPQILLSAGSAVESFGVEDPTLFVLPTRRGFSGPAWMKVPAINPAWMKAPDVAYPLADWNEPPRTLPLPEEDLGGAMAAFAQSHSPPPLKPANVRGLQLEDLPFPASPDLLPTQSTLTVEGGLAGWPLLSSFKLDSWPSTEILTNSEVQIAVDSEGRVFTLALVKTCGSKDADANAVARARSARFQRLPDSNQIPTANLVWGKLVFHWVTIAPPSTNDAPGKTP